MKGVFTKITGTGSAFPSRIMTNRDLEKLVETSDAWIFERTGIRERRVASSDPRETNSMLAAQAAKAALAMANKGAMDIELILVATVSPDQIMPNCACLVQEALGARLAGAVDVSAACSGFVYALSMADAYIRSGMYKTVLVIGSEILSPIVDWSDRGTCILFGDGAGAMLVEQTADPSSSRIFGSKLYADGWAKDMFHVPAGGSTLPASHETINARAHFMQMKGREIFKVAVRMLSDIAVETVEAHGYRISDLDWIVPHQANLRILEAVAKRLAFPMGKMLVNLDRYGNTSAATVPTAFDEGVRTGKIQRDDLVLFDVFGAGLTFGTSLLRF